MRYDSSVCNSENTIVQFKYSGDSLNPALMEDNDRPIDFCWLHLHITQLYPCRDESFLGKETLLAIIDEKLAEPNFQNLLPKGQMFHDEIQEYFASAASKLEIFLCDADICTTECMFSQRMYHKETDTPAHACSTTVTDLGQIKFIFSTATGIN